MNRTLEVLCSVALSTRPYATSHYNELPNWCMTNSLALVRHSKADRLLESICLVQTPRVISMQAVFSEPAEHNCYRDERSAKEHWQTSRMGDQGCRPAQMYRSGHLPIWPRSPVSRQPDRSNYLARAVQGRLLGACMNGLTVLTHQPLQPPPQALRPIPDAQRHQQAGPCRRGACHVHAAAVLPAMHTRCTSGRFHHHCTV